MSQKQQLPLLTLRDLVVFPHAMLPLFIGRSKSISAVEDAMNKGTKIVLVAQKDPKANDPDTKDIYSVGVAANIVQLVRLPDGTVKVLVEGLERVKIDNYESTSPFFVVSATYSDFKEKNDLEVRALIKTIKDAFSEYVKINKRVTPETLMRVTGIDSPNELADVIAAQLTLKLEQKQEILEIFDSTKRLELVLKHLTGEVELIEVEKAIKARIKKQMDQSQKEYYLTEQMSAIQKELGEKGDAQEEIKELEVKLKQKKMSEEAYNKTSKELKKLKVMSPMSAEAAVIRNYIDWMVSLPWKDYAVENDDVNFAKEVLDNDHWGLEKVKDRILEYLSAVSLSKSLKGPILCLVGPPGVGKTSLARSIADSLGRPFVRISLGGVRDEAEIRGHRKTYVGAMPGKIIQSLKKVDKGNPLILLDEIDKMASDFRGDPGAAMLEVLDPEQNSTFQDHYLEVEYDLSKIMFVATANSLHTIPRPLLDRMEVISLEGYIEQEKFHITKKYLVPKQIKNHGLDTYGVSFQDSAIVDLIRYYTREAGIRNLERQVGNVCRKLTKEIVMSKKSGSKKSYTITPKKVVELLGPHKYKFGKIEGKNEIGLTNGMAWTEVGGDLLSVEVSVMPGKGKVTFTGQLGNVMKESCTAAMSYARSRGSLFGLNKEYFDNIDVHIHFPEGATPKDGPSAGIALTTSIVSALTKTPVKKTVAMTGEVSLRGKVWAIGGLKEKILAAYRGGIKTIICPKPNKKDLKDIPKEVLSNLNVILVEHVDQVLVNALDIKSPKDLFKQSKDSNIGVMASYKGHESYKTVQTK